jgi:hypothetical protein
VGASNAGSALPSILAEIRNVRSAARGSCCLKEQERNDLRCRSSSSWCAPTARIEASVHNDSPYRVTDVELAVEGLSADQHSVGQRFVWALGDIDPGSESSFVTEAMPGAVTYRITVISFDIVSAEPPR